MNLPFTTDQFLATLEQYNNAVWPFQIVMNLLAVTAMVLSYKQSAGSDKIISGILAFLWLWIGVVYHFTYFTAINSAAYGFGIFSVLAGIIFFAFGILRPRLLFAPRFDLFGITGWVLILYGLVVYPVLGHFLGHVFPGSPTFGLPCPTTIFTFGILLWTKPRIPLWVLVIPFLWSLIGSSAALTLGIREDTGLLVAGIAGTVLIILRDRNARTPEMATEA